MQLACVVRLGGCPSSRDGGIPSTEEIAQYNAQCRSQPRSQRPYTGPDIYPTDEECRNPPREPLTTTEKIFLGAFLVAGAVVAVAVTIAAAEVVIPAVVSGLATAEGAAVSAWAFYAGNAIVINEVGLFTAGLVFACDGDVAGLLRAIANDPVQAAQILAEVYMLKVNIQVANGPVRPAKVPVRLLPPEQQTEPHTIQFKTVGPPEFEPGPEAGGGAGRQTTPRPAGGAPEHAEGVESQHGAAPRTGAPGAGAPRFFDSSRGALTDTERGKLAAVRKQFRLPETPTPGDTTIVGVLRLETGEELPIHSGMFGGPSGGVHRGNIGRGGGSGATRYNISHVESHAAAIMQERDIKRAVLVIEKEPCAACAGYQKVHPETDVQAPNLTKLLPKDSQLLVVDPDQVTYFRSSQ